MFSFTKQPSLFLFIKQFKFYFEIFEPSNIKTFFCANVKHIFIFDIFLLFLRKWRFLPGPGTAVLKNNPSSDENRHKKAFPVDPEIES